MNDTITIVGVIGTDPEKTNPNGVPITKFRVASKERRFDRVTGTWVDGDTNWYTVSTYRRLAEHVFSSLRKRDRVILTGRLHVRNWEAGDKRGTSVDIDAEAIGPELQFGTTTFAAVAAEASNPAAASTDESWALTDGSAQGWANPGVGLTANPDSLTSGQITAEADPALAHGDARSPALVGADTPF